MWPFKRKPKVKAVEPPPPPPPEPVEEKPPEPREIGEPNWAERIANVIADRKQPFRDALDWLIDAQPTQDLEPVISLVRPMFDTALNKNPCPCGSEIIFRECCKPRWKALQQMHADQRRAKRQESEAARQEEAKLRADERSRENISWMVRIGQDERGRIMMDPLDTSRKFSARQVCDALEVSAWQAREMIMGEAIQQKIVQFLVRSAQNQPRK